MTPSMPPPGLTSKPKKPAVAIEVDASAPKDGNFACPSCGAKLCCEPAEESDAEHSALGMTDDMSDEV